MEAWSWPSPPATLTATTGLPSFRTSVGVRVMRGLLPGTMQLGWPSQMLKLCRRLPSQTPVSPASAPLQPLGAVFDAAHIVCLLVGQWPCYSVKHVVR